MSDMIVRHAAQQRLALWYRWQLSLGEKKCLLRHFKPLIEKAYGKSKVPGIALYLPTVTAMSPEQTHFTRTIILSRLILLFFYIQEHRIAKKKLDYSSSTEKIGERVNTFITEFDTFLKDHAARGEDAALLQEYKKHLSTANSTEHEAD